MRTDIQIVENCYEMLRRGDIERLLTVFDAGIEWVQPEGLTPYGLGGTRIGTEGARQFLDRVPDVFAELRREPDRYVGLDGASWCSAHTMSARRPESPARWGSRTSGSCGTGR